MRIPRELADVLPMWQCSRCGIAFKDNNLTHCVLCGGERRPPSNDTIEHFVLRHFAKIAGIKYVALPTHQERSVFAHQVLEPKLSQKHREQLCIFFTTLLDSGWEDSGGSDPTDNGAWDDCNGTVTGTAYDGSYACQFSSGEKGEMYGLNVNELYVRFYVRTSEVASNTILAFITDAGWANSLRIGYDNTAWQIVTEDGTSTDGTIAADTWYCVEFRRNNSGNVAQMWVNGNLLFNLTPTVTNNCYNVNVGCISTDGAPTVIIDCVVIADAGPIGCLGATYTKTGTLGARIVSQPTKTGTLGTTIQGTATKAGTLGGRIVSQQTKEGTLGSRIIAQLTKTGSLGGTVKGTETKTGSLGALIRPELVNQCFTVISTNIQPTKGSARFQASNGGSLVIEYFGAANLGNLKIWHSMIPWTSFGSLAKEAEDCTLAGGADTEDLADDVTASARLNAQNETVYWDLDALPAGRYIVLFRVKDTAQVADDLQVSVENTSDAEYRNQENDDVLKTLTADFAYIQLVFDITSDDVSGVDNIRVSALKATATANAIYVDSFLVVPVTNGEGWIQDVAHNALRMSGQKFTPRRRN